MSQRIVERVIGRLVTDEELRLEFTRAPRSTLEALRERGWELNHAEVDALMSTDIGLWGEIAGRIDSRLQRCSPKELRRQAKTYSRANIPEGTAIVSPFGIPDEKSDRNLIWTNVQTPIDVNGDDATLDGQLVVFDFDVRGKERPATGMA